MCLEKSVFAPSPFKLSLKDFDMPEGRRLYSMPESEKTLSDFLIPTSCYERNSWAVNESQTYLDGIGALWLITTDPVALMCDLSSVPHMAVNFDSFTLQQPAGVVELGASGEFGFAFIWLPTPTSSIGEGTVLRICTVQWEIAPGSSVAVHTGNRDETLVDVVPEGGVVLCSTNDIQVGTRLEITAMPVRAISMPRGLIPCMFPSCSASLSPGGSFVEDDVDLTNHLVNNAATILANYAMPLSPSELKGSPS